MTDRPRAKLEVLRDRARGAMVGLAIGDALGATVEFMTPREIQHEYGVHERIVGGGWLRLARGEVTDDTTMTFALADAWLAAGGPPDASACAMAFDAWMRGKPVDIGNTVRRGIVRWRTYGTPCAEPSDYAAGNGGAMRCLPVALGLVGGEPAAVCEAALTQARVTHHNPLADAATVTVVQMVQAALGGGSPGEVIACADELSRTHPQFEWRSRRCENPSGYVVDTLQAVFQALEAHLDFASVLVDVVNRGGDADTTGAISGMVAGAGAGYSGLPERWLQALQASVHDRAIGLADGLLALSPAGQAACTLRRG